MTVSWVPPHERLMGVEMHAMMMMDSRDLDRILS